MQCLQTLATLDCCVHVSSMVWTSWKSFTAWLSSFTLPGLLTPTTMHTMSRCTFSEQPDGFALIALLACIMASRQGVGPQTLTQCPPCSVMLQTSQVLLHLLHAAALTVQRTGLKASECGKESRSWQGRRLHWGLKLVSADVVNVQRQVDMH